MARTRQTFANHRQVVPSYHFITLGTLAVLLCGAVYYVILHKDGDIFLPVMFLLLVLATISLALHARFFALRAQDRAIRAEENLRYFILTGKRLSRQLSTAQVIALRFASDEEFVELSQKAADQKISPTEIKKMIKEWRPDYRRV